VKREQDGHGHGSNIGEVAHHNFMFLFLVEMFHFEGNMSSKKKTSG
jgi:hypothetical protein